MAKTRKFSLLMKPIAFNRYFVDLAGTTDAALLLSQAVYWSERTSDPKGWFYKTQKEWQEETGLTRSQQEVARKRLRATDFWKERLRGNPASLYFLVDCRILQTRLLEMAKLECEIPQTSLQDSASSFITEITSETTQRNGQLIFQAVEESEKTGIPADEILARLRASA